MASVFVFLRNRAELNVEGEGLVHLVLLDCEVKFIGRRPGPYCNVPRHYILHYLLLKDKEGIYIEASRNLENKRVEWEANWFAAELLMPALEFKNMLKRTTDVVSLASHFDVSVSATEVRKRSVS